MAFHIKRATSGLPRAHESSIVRSPRDSDDVNRQWIRNNKGYAQIGSDRDAIEQLSKKVEMLRRRILSLNPEIPDKWQQPYKELDPEVDVAKGTWVYVSPNNDLVLTGLVDRVSSTTVQAYPGIWEAAQDVAATDGTNYNVPTTDYPSTTPSGSPLRGDLDDDDVYWILICPTCNL